MARTGRPLEYTKDIAKEICERIASGESLNNICKDDHMPDKGTVIRWAMNFEEREELKDFCNQYAQARQIQAENMSDEITDIADDGTNDWMEKQTKSGNVVVVGDHEHMQRSKLRVEARQWIAEKLLPKKFGVKQQIEHSGGFNVSTVNYSDVVKPV